MPNPMLIEGNVDESHSRLRALELENESLRDDLAIARAEAERAKNQAVRAVGELRRQLSPLYQALRMVFGEIDAIIPETSASASGVAPAPQKQAVWDAWKQRLTPNAGKIIDALLTHGDLSSSQVAIATGIASGNVAKYIYELNKASLINKNGGRFSLKQL